MQVYIAIYLFNTILSYLNSKIDTKKLLILSFGVLNIFLCFNYLNGIDWIQYQRTFINTPNLLEIGDVNSLKQVKIRGSEVLFIYLVAAFKLIPNLNYEIFQYILLTINLSVIYYFINKHSKNPLLIILLLTQFLIYMMFEPILRQLQSLIIFLYAVEDIKKRNMLRYLKLIGLATLFHSSAIILIPLYFMYTLEFNLKKINLLLLIILGFVFISDTLVSQMMRISFLSHYIGYLKSEKYGLQSFDSLRLIKIFIRDGVIINLIHYLKIKNRIRIRNYRLVLIGYIIFVILKMLSLKIGIIFRFNNYFMIFSIIYLSYLFEVLKNNKLVIIFKIIIISYYFMSFTEDIENKKVDKYKMIPYSNYLLEKNRFENDYQKINYRWSYRSKYNKGKVKF